MTVQECIDIVDGYMPNAYNENVKSRWVRECEGKVYRELFLLQPRGFVGVTWWESGTRSTPTNPYLDEELSIPAPYNQIYQLYLEAQIHYHNAEPDRYNMTMTLFNDLWHQLVVWFGQDYDVSDWHRNPRVNAEIPMWAEEPDQLDRLRYVSDARRYAVMNLPENCALVGGQIFCKSAFWVGSSLTVVVATETAEEVCSKTMTAGDTLRIPMLIAPPGGATILISVSSDYVVAAAEETKSVRHIALDETEHKLMFTGRLLVPEEVHLDWRKLMLAPANLAETEVVD